MGPITPFEVGVPYGYCQCGCGQKTKPAVYTSTARGQKRGQPVKFVLGHATRVPGVPDYVVEDRGYDTPCWIWQRSVSHRGYGQANRDGESLAHRWYYIQERGPIPAGLVLDHLCRVTRCCNPDHLEAVTQAENILRGVAPSAAWTHCKHGHEFTPENTYVAPTSGYRRCRTCRTRLRREAYLRERCS